MKILRILICVAVLILAPLYAFSAELGAMRISLMEGDVQILTPEAGDWGLAAINIPIGQGDQIWVPEGGRVELQLDNGSYIRLDQNSALQVLSLESGASQFYLSQGRSYVYFNAPSGSVLQLDNTDASLRSFDRAVFNVDMYDQYSDVAVYYGYIDAENSVGQMRINAGELLSLGQATNGEFSPVGPPDDWGSWNRSRDRVISAVGGGGSRYLPAELSAYSNDLDANGRWVTVPEYGTVWTPTVSVSIGWAPYSQGRWIWRDGDYVWVADEPWGWAPYHYGRWAFIAGRGWCWVPPAAGAVYWGPGYVGWVRTADYVGWVPLAPGETYYGRGNHGPHSINISVVRDVRERNVYKNSYVTGGVTVVEGRSFGTGSPRHVRPGQNDIRQKIFTKNNMSVGAPAIKPSRESYFPAQRTIAPNKRPPRAVADIRPDRIKESRPLVKERDRSVMRPGIEHKPLPVNRETAPRTPGKERPAIRPVAPAERHPAGPPPRVEQKPVPQPQPRIEQKPAPQPQPRIEQKPVPQPQPRIEQKPAPQPQPRIEQKPVPQPQPRIEQKPTPQPQPRIEQKPAPQPQPRIERQPAPPPKVEQKPAPQPEKKPAPEQKGQQKEKQEQGRQER
jgi:hypothetical protein